MRDAIDSAIRRALHLYWRLTRGLTLGVRGLVIDADRRILLVRPTYVRGCHLPGGGVGPGETLRAVACGGGPSVRRGGPGGGGAAGRARRPPPRSRASSPRRATSCSPRRR